jgi:flagellin-like hook-associated protein FlgL
MKRANNLLTKSLQRLSSGKRIVSPSDDAGGLAVGMKLQSSLRRTAASRMNTQNGVSFLQMQDGVMKVAGEILDRMSELKSFYNDISKNATDRETYNHEFHELQKELNSLKAQKLNGVSLFASTEGNGTLGISTSDDGLGEKIELKRTGFFENLKSKFGADSVLNSGSQGSYRQLVGDFSRDGGVNDPKPGNTSRAYGSGEVVYKTGISDADSGYFMATKDVNPGIKISVGGANTNWLKIADKSGNGFVEAFPEAKEFDSFSLKRTSDGRQMSYLKGDVVKVPAHWDSPGSYFYLKAQTDVPYGKTLNDIYNENQVGPSKFFDYVGQNANGIPTTDFVRANANLPDPSLFNPTNATSFINLFNSHLSNNYTPGFVKVDAANDPFLNGGAAPVATGSTKQVTTIKGIAGDMQVKEINIENLFGDQADAFTINVTIDGVTTPLSYSAISSATTATGGSANIANGIAGLLSNVKLADGVTNAFTNVTTPGNINGLSNIVIEGSAAAKNFSVSIVPNDNTLAFNDSNVYASTARVLETEGTPGGANPDINVPIVAGSTNPLQQALVDVTYELQNKFWGDGSTISALNPADLGDIAKVGTQYYQAQANTTINDPTSVAGAPDWIAIGAAGATLEDLAFGNLGGVRVAAGATNAGAFVARADAVDRHQYIADSYTMNFAGGVTGSVTVDYNTDKATTADDIVAAINADPTLSAGVTAARNGDEVEITAKASGVPFTTTITTNDNHNNSTSTHNKPSANGFPGNTAFASAVAEVTTPIPAPVVGAPAAPGSAAYGVYVPASNWGIEKWDATSSFQAGDRVLDTASERILEMNSNVKGAFIGQATAIGDLVLDNGIWYEATAANAGTAGPSSGTGGWNAGPMGTGVDILALGATDKNAEFMDLTNESIWTRTHHGDLVGKTISMNYNRGDNIFYQGKHYIYTSSVPSNDIIYNPDGDGYTEFEDLLSAGAIVEAPIYIDTRGGGGSATGNPDIFYRPNQDLEFVDRLPNSGTVRTNSIERRSDSARFPGDEIFNSRDDQYYGGLNAGNDGIYGTADDFYSTTSNPDTARAGGHVDSDADNNKDLLDTANGLENFSVADFVDYIQSLANMRAVNGGTMSRLNYATNILEENEINLGAATSRIMDADMAQESTMMARQNVLLQASASMITQANQLSSIVLSLLQ